MADMSIESLLSSCGSDGRAERFAGLALELQQEGQLHLATTALDRAFGLAPNDAAIAATRGRLLDELAMEVDGIEFRYVPGGSFLMGSEAGDADAQPVHAVRVGHCWISSTPVSWSLYCRLMGWQPPPAGSPAETPDGDARFLLYNTNKIRLQYCEDHTLRARGWHAHDPDAQWRDGAGKITTSRQMFGEIPRDQPDEPWQYAQKPMVAASWTDAGLLCHRLNTLYPNRWFLLPTEAEWEKAARGGLIGAQYSWGNDPPDATRCDFDRFDEFSIRRPRQFPPNAYGLYGMCGGVWEWTQDWYDAGYYGRCERRDPAGPAEGIEKVLRGGSWADCAEAVTVSFRNSHRVDRCACPNIGFRLCCVDGPPPVRQIPQPEANPVPVPPPVPPPARTPDSNPAPAPAPAPAPTPTPNWFGSMLNRGLGIFRRNR
ncbi:MAG: SUMF1/EgtB/PvdO family nonheme iron enzyme [Tepidisphaeraceae bacterium]|jgi:formylglycine-generating enzyme required for sulfatase activity